MKKTLLQLAMPVCPHTVAADEMTSNAPVTPLKGSQIASSAGTSEVKRSGPTRSPWSPHDAQGVCKSLPVKREREYIEVLSDSEHSPVLLREDDQSCHSKTALKLSATPVKPPDRTPPAATSPRSGDDETAEEPSAPTLSNEQQFILDLVVKHQRSVFLTGGGGTGKSFLLREIIDNLDKRTTFVTAPTGIAALNVGGVTLHSFSGIGLGEGSREDLLGRVRGNKAARLSWQSCRVLIIDEVSMVPKKLLDDLEYIARRIRGREEPFGGIQLVLCGDFLQLPPVSKRSRYLPNECDFCFASQSWARINPRVFILRTLFRQHSDALFATILHELRLGQLSHDSIHTMMSISHSTRAAFVETTADGDTVITDDQGLLASDRREGRTVLRSTNAVVKDINEDCFGNLLTAIHSFSAVTGGPQPNLLDACPAEPEVTLRVGARVMLLKNLDQRAGLVNGSIGVVTTFVEADQVSRDLLNPPNSRDWLKRMSRSANPMFPVVRFSIQRYSAHDRKLMPADRDLVVQPQNWTVMSGNRELAFRWQIPLKLAWAITIHKSQGMTLQNVNVDFDGMFEDAQAYVALSRCTTLQGLTIENFDLRRVRTNVHALAYYDDLEAIISRSGGDASMYTLPQLAENPWGATQPEDEPSAPDETPTQSSKMHDAAVVRIRSKLPSALVDEASRKRLTIHRPLVTLRNGVVHMTQGIDCGSHDVVMSELVIPIGRVASCYVVLDTCSLMALHNYPATSQAVQRLCDENFVRAPQLLLTELDGLTKHHHDQTAFAARKARNLLKALLLDGAIELQGSNDSVDPSTVFALGGDGSISDPSTRKDNPILCYAAFLQRNYRTPIVVCTEDCLLGLRANACGFSSCSVSSGF